MTTICLCMIVKNEAAVIRRCLDSVRPIIDHWVIVDTGSTDGTQGIIGEYLRDLPGELHERPWRDFAHNRSEALELARGKSDYTLIIDADDTLELVSDATIPELTADSYTLEIGDTTIVYRRQQLVRSALPWRYEGVLHEYLTCEGANPPGHLSEIRMRRNHDGARRKDPQTYRRDAAVLEAALQTETRPSLVSRYRFYLAQSYRDCGEREKALENYLARAELGFWQEEVFVALYQAARMKEQLGHPDQEIIDAYLRASDALPTRAEALHGASRFCRAKSRFEQGYQLAKRGVTIPLPSNALFVETWVYQYGLLDELALHSYWTTRYQESLDACEALLAGAYCPEDQRKRIAANADFARDKLRCADTGEVSEKPRRRPKIAIYTIALNEAHHVERWYKSAADADYLVVADTGSTDDTAERLAAAGVSVHRIVIRPWRFDDARNAALALVPGDADICISLDMDEFMFPGWRARLEASWRPDTTRLYYQFASTVNPDGSPARSFRKGKIHSRRGYRWRRIVHEDLQRTEPDERTASTDAVLIGQLQDLAKDRGQYLPLMEQAHKEDPRDAQLCFWFAREQMYAGLNEQSAATFLEYLNIPEWDWHDERAEAMRYLARIQPEKSLEWLRKAIDEAGHRRELWLDLAEYYHSRRDWHNLFWASVNGIDNTRRTDTYLDEPYAWGFRLYDLAALACWHLGLVEQAIKHGGAALELLPGDERLTANLAFYNGQQTGQHSRVHGARDGVRPAGSALEAIERVINRDHHIVTLELPEDRRTEWTVCTVALPGYIHSAGLAEIAQTVGYGLAKLGFRVNYVTEVSRLSEHSVLIGGHLLSPEDTSQVRSTTIVYNTEHVNSVVFTPTSQHYVPHYIDMLSRAIVWDYSAANALNLGALLGHDVLYVPLGYAPEFRRISKQAEDIDILFYGWMKPRRQALLDDLTRRGLAVHYASAAYGLERDRLVARSKVVLNIHSYLPGAFEIIRVGYLLANGKAVVSEVNDGEKVDDDLVGGFLGVPYEEIADTAFALVHDLDHRQALERAGFQKFSARCEALILREALDQTYARRSRLDSSNRKRASAAADEYVECRSNFVADLRKRNLQMAI